jgi:hypothetical protein
MDLFEEVSQNLQEHFKASEPVAASTEATPVTETPVTTEPVITEPVVTEPVKVESPAPPKTEEYYKDLGYESPDHLKSSLTELKQKAEEYEKRLPYFSELEKEFENAMKIMDPLSPSGLFKGDEKKYNTFLKAMKVGEGKDMDNPSVFSVVNRIASTDLDKISDMDVVNLQWQYDAPRFAGSDETIKKEILKQIGVDIEDADFNLETFKLSPGQDLTLSRMAQTAREKFNQAKANVQKPETPDFRKAINDQVAAKAAAEKTNKETFDKMAQSWDEEAKRVAPTLSKIEFVKKNDKNEDVVDFTFEMEKEFQNEIPKMIQNYALSNRLAPTQENVQHAKELVKSVYISENYQKLVEAHTNAKLTELRDQLDKERYNGKDFNTATPPPGREDDVNKLLNDGIIKMTGLKI